MPPNNVNSGYARPLMRRYLKRRSPPTIFETERMFPNGSETHRPAAHPPAFEVAQRRKGEDFARFVRLFGRRFPRRAEARRGNRRRKLPFSPPAPDVRRAPVRSGRALADGNSRAGGRVAGGPIAPHLLRSRVNGPLPKSRRSTVLSRGR